MIAHSQIVVAEPARRFLAGLDEVDLAILDWIIAEGRLAGRRYPADVTCHCVALGSAAVDRPTVRPGKPAASK